MKSSNWLRLVAAVLAVAMFGAACGSDSDDEGAEETTTTAAAAEETTTTAAAASDDRRHRDNRRQHRADQDRCCSPRSPALHAVGHPGPGRHEAGRQRDQRERAASTAACSSWSVTDDQSNAEEAIAGFERMIEDGVVAIGGPISSDVGLITSQLAESSRCRCSW